MNDSLPCGDPSPWVCRFAPLIPAGGAVLDLASGAGRHARFLADCGYRVEAVDQDAELLANLAHVAGVNARHADLERGPWPYFGRAFEGIVVTRYLWRPLLPHLFNCLAQNGVLIYETFMVGNEHFGKPSNPEYLLRPGELLDLLHKRFSIIAFEQGKVEKPQPAMVQRIAVRRGWPDRLPD